MNRIHHLLLFDTSFCIHSIPRRKNIKTHLIQLERTGGEGQWHRKIYNKEKKNISGNNHKTRCGYFVLVCELEKLVINNLDIVKKAEYLFPLYAFSLSHSLYPTRLDSTAFPRLHKFTVKRKALNTSSLKLYWLTIGSCSHLPFLSAFLLCRGSKTEAERKGIIKVSIAKMLA